MRKTEILQREKRAFAIALDRIVNSARNHVVRGLKAREGSFHYVPYPPSTLFHMFEHIHRTVFRGHTKNKFLDAGCGVGHVPFIAHCTELAAECHGIDIEKKYIDYGRQIFSAGTKGTFKLWKSDIMDFDKYSEYDVLYYFCPFTHPYLEKVFEERLEDEMKVGAFLIALNKCSGAKDPRFQIVKNTSTSYPILKKIKDGPRTVSSFSREDIERTIRDMKKHHSYPRLKEVLKLCDEIKNRKAPS